MVNIVLFVYTIFCKEIVAQRVRMALKGRMFKYI